VLIDDSEKAVLCDFGLSRMKADVISRTSGAGSGGVVGSRNWMAPEIFLGGSLREPCDIYAFGMLIFEVIALLCFLPSGMVLLTTLLAKIYTNEVPLGHLHYAELVNMVLTYDIRPERPAPREAPQLTDDIWQLAEQCWVKEPSARPKIDTVSESVSHSWRSRLEQKVSTFHFPDIHNG
jgi:serine/threonine protein kinase